MHQTFSSSQTERGVTLPEWPQRERERWKSKIKVACIRSLRPSSHIPYESQIQTLHAWTKALALWSSPHDVMYRKVFLSLNLSAHASSSVIWYTSKGSEKMLVILRQGLHLFHEKEAYFPAVQSGLRFTQQIKILMHSFSDHMMKVILCLCNMQRT